MADIESLYKKVDGRILIEIKLSSVMQLFNSFDPAPFHEKELDSAAEHYIVDTVKDFSKKTRFKIIIYLPPDIASTERAQKIPQAIHNHFEYKKTRRTIQRLDRRLLAVDSRLDRLATAEK